MNHCRSSSRFLVSRSILCSAMLALGAGACHSTSNSTEGETYHSGRVDLSRDLTAQASVVSVDRPARLITLRREDGVLFTVEATPAVRNFDQIMPGDTLRVRYQESLSAMRLPAGSTTTPMAGGVAAGRAGLGDKPAAGVGAVVTARVRIASVDHENHIVVFTLDSGEYRTVGAVRPEGKQFVNTLKVGDVVQLDCSASVVLAVDRL